MERPAKLRRLNAFRRSMPHVTASALSAILKAAAADELPALASRRDIREATQAVMSDVTPYGTIARELTLRTTEGGEMTTVVAHPLAFLWRAARYNVAFAEFLKERLAVAPSTAEHPWRLVLYSDEVVPGNQLSHDNKRKVWVVYFSFLEFGTAALSREDMWFCVLACRSSEVSRVSGGMGQVFGAIAKLFFGGDVHDMSVGGVVMNLEDGTAIRLFARLDMFLQDGGAHKAVWHCKGDAGTKLCMLCRNLYSESSELADEDGSDLLTCSLIYESQLDFATDEDIRSSVRRLAARRATETTVTFAKWCQAVGFRHEPHGMLLDPSLDHIVQPASQFVHDWMHAVFVHGVFNTVGYFVLEACINAGMNVYETLNDYVATWAWPCRVDKPSLCDVFVKKRATASRKAKHLKCTASEGLSVYPVMAHFFRVVVMRAGRCIQECTAFLKLAAVIDVLVAIPFGIVSAELLREHVQAFLVACEAAGWRNAMHPKFHWLVHLPRHLHRFHCLPTCWVHERKHRMVKRYASDVCNTRVYERTVLGEVCAHHLASLAEPSTFDFKVGLIGGRPCPAKMIEMLSSALELTVHGLEFTTAVNARVSEHIVCHKSDVVLLDPESGAGFDVGIVWLFAAVAGESLALVSVWNQVSSCRNSGTAEYQDLPKPILVTLDSIVCPLVYSRCRPGIVRIIVPMQYRSAL